MCVTIDGVWINDWFIDSIYKRLVITSNYGATTNLNSSQITTAPAKPFPACCVFTSLFLATASNSWNSSASRAQVFPSPTPELSLNCPLPCLQNPSTDHTENISSIVACVFAAWLRTNIGISDYRKHSSFIIACMLLALPNNGHCLQSHRLRTGL
jgi:hypothetical protein